MVHNESGAASAGQVGNGMARQSPRNQPREHAAGVGRENFAAARDQCRAHCRAGAVGAQQDFE